MKQTLDLSPLAPDYEIVGELDDTADSRTYIGTRRGDGTKRRDDQTAVLITVVGTPDGDEANALSRLAADTKLLMYTPHRRLVPPFSGSSPRSRATWAPLYAFAASGLSQPSKRATK